MKAYLDLIDRCANIHAGVVEEDVDRATLLGDGGDAGVHCREVCHIHFKSDGFAAGGFDGGDGFVELAAGAGGTNDGGPCGAHACGATAAYAAPGAGDDDDLVREKAHGRRGEGR